MLVGSALGYFGNDVFKETEDDTGDEVSESESEEEDDVEEEDSPDGEECPECGEEHPSYVLDVGGSSSITIPEGWYVSQIIGDYIPAPDEIINELPLIMADATFFVTEKYSVTLTDGSSSITISDVPPYILGPFGVTPGNLDPGYVVVLEPTPDVNGLQGCRQVTRTHTSSSTSATTQGSAQIISCTATRLTCTLNMKVD